MYRIDIDYIYHLKTLIDDINKQQLKDVVFVKDGKVLDIPSSVFEEWSFIGLNNMDFITSNFWQAPKQAKNDS